MTAYQKQASDFLTNHGITFKAKFMGDKCPIWCDGKHIHGDRYLVTFRRGKQSLTLSFWNSLHDQENGKAPTSYDVLAAIEKYEVGTYEDFCSNYGYDTDSRKAYTTYKLVLKEYTKVSGFFTESELTELQEIN